MSPQPARLVARLADAGEVTVRAGELVTVPDPALLALVAGLVPRAAGEVRVDGKVVRGGPAARARRGIAAVLDAPVAPEVPVVDHLAARVGSADARAALGSCPLLAGRDDDPAGVLSGGERRALAWLRAVVLHPRVVVLHDATVGLDPETISWTEEIVEGWLAGGAAVLTG